MAAFSGKQGKVSFDGGTTGTVLSWSIDATCDVADGTAMTCSAVGADTHWKDYLVGFKNWTATAECLLDSAGYDPSISADLWDGNGAALILYESVTDASPVCRKYSGTAFITGISSIVDKEDVAKVTYTFQGSDTLSVAADEI